MGSNTELVNVVYLDNSSLELYHSLLDKRPNAVTYRLRCDQPTLLPDRPPTHPPTSSTAAM